MTLDILVVDDKYASDICRNMYGALEPEKVRFEEARDRDEAIRKLSNKKFDLVVLDYNMPGRNGYQTAKDIRELGIDVELAGFSSDWDEDEAREVGLAVYGMNQDPIVEYISKMLANRTQKPNS